MYMQVHTAGAHAVLARQVMSVLYSKLPWTPHLASCGQTLPEMDVAPTFLSELILLNMNNEYVTCRSISQQRVSISMLNNKMA